MFYHHHNLDPNRIRSYRSSPRQSNWWEGWSTQPSAFVMLLARVTTKKAARLLKEHFVYFLFFFRSPRVTMPTNPEWLTYSLPKHCCLLFTPSSSFTEQIRKDFDCGKLQMQYIALSQFNCTFITYFIVKRTSTQSSHDLRCLLPFQ